MCLETNFPKMGWNHQFSKLLEQQFVVVVVVVVVVVMFALVCIGTWGMQANIGF